MYVNKILLTPNIDTLLVVLATICVMDWCIISDDNRGLQITDQVQFTTPVFSASEHTLRDEELRRHNRESRLQFTDEPRPRICLCSL